MDSLAAVLERARASLPRSSGASKTVAITAASLLASYLFLGSLNRSLSQRAQNNWTTDTTWDWSKEIVLVTGGSGGIGSEIIAKLKARNVKVINVDVVQSEDSGTKGVPFYKVDLTSEDNVAGVADRIRAEHGHPTVIINNAGIGNGKLILDIPVDKIRKVFEVNLIAHFTMVKQFVPDMIKNNHGHIVTIASMASFATQASNVDYACTKIGAMAFNEGLQQELVHYYNAPKVRTSCVHPIWVRTPMIEDLTKSGKFDQPTVEPCEVADAVVKTLFQGNSRQIVVPEQAAIMASLRSTPHWLQVRVRNHLSKALQGLVVQGSSR